MRNAQRREGPLELGAWITAVRGGLIAKEREPVGVEGSRTAMVQEVCAAVRIPGKSSGLKTGCGT